jgi:integrase
MSRPRTGQVTEWRWEDDRTITYGARLRAYGRRHRLVFGTNHQGWNRIRAEVEVEQILQQVQRGTWTPPKGRTSVTHSRRAPPDGHQPFGPFARRIIDAMKTQGLDEDAIAEMEWRLVYLLDRFGELELLEIDVAGVDDFRDDLADRAELNREHTVRDSPPPGTITPQDGQTHKPPEWALSNGSINAILTLLGEIMQRAVDDGYVLQNPLKVGERRDRFLPTPKRGPTLPKLD